MRNAPAVEDLDEVLRQARDRFISVFPARCLEMQGGFARMARGAPPPDDLRQVIHKLAGLSGTVGFSEVGRIASELEELVISGTSGTDVLLRGLRSMRAAFEREVTQPIEGADTAAPVRLEGRGRKVLVVDDDDDQRRLTTRALEHGGYDVVSLPRADTLLETAQDIEPDAILLDVMMPGIDGHLACRALKAEPTVANLPVIFVSSHAALEERVAGLALGAVDYVAKPVDVNELLFRVKRAIDNHGTVAAPLPVLAEVLEYPAFVEQAAAALAASACTLMLLRIDPKNRQALADALIGEARRRDLIAQFDRLHLVTLFPDRTSDAVLQQFGPVLDSLVRQGVDVRAGVAASASGCDTPVDALVAEADEALAAARFHGATLSQKGEKPAVTPAEAVSSHLVLLADDDPEVMRIVDAQMRSLRFDTSLAFDGQMALTALTARPVNLLILDLMLPKVTGFEILHQLRLRPAPHPRLIVLSARGREEDITRAFELGADDYITKPFRPQELAARVVRLLR